MKMHLFPRGTLLDEAWVDLLEAKGVQIVQVRSPISCDLVSVYAHLVMGATWLVVIK
jgi:hypothetical protein